MSARPTTVSGYIRAIAADRRNEFEELRAWVRSALPRASETMTYRMPTYETADARLICAIAAQKHHLALYVCQPGSLGRHRDAFSHLDMGKGCIRFRHFSELPRGAARKLLAEAAREAGGKTPGRAKAGAKKAPRGGTRKTSTSRVAQAAKKPAARAAGNVSVDTLRSLALALPSVEEGTSYGTPAWRVKGKLMTRLREDGDTVVMKVGDELRDLLMEADPERYFITDHYVGYPMVLLRLSNISRGDLAKVLEEAWRVVAPTRLRDAHDAG